MVFAYNGSVILALEIQRSKKMENNDEANRTQEINFPNNNTSDNKNENVKKSNLLIERKQFLKLIDENEEILEILSIDRLKKLEKYYDSIIEKNNEILKKLKKKQ